MSLGTEFRTFVTRGNLMDLAVGFTVGAAFTTVAKSLVADIIMPVTGRLIGNVDFKDFFLVLRSGKGGESHYPTIADAQADGAVTLNYGLFVNNIVALLLVGIAMFMILRLIKRIQDGLEDDAGTSDHAPQEPDDKKCRFCRTTIPYRATRCPHCTSQLADHAASESEDGDGALGVASP